jgi:hypothetical protein
VLILMDTYRSDVQRAEEEPTAYAADVDPRHLFPAKGMPLVIGVIGYVSGANACRRVEESRPGCLFRRP